MNLGFFSLVTSDVMTKGDSFLSETRERDRYTDLTKGRVEFTSKKAGGPSC